MHHAKFECHSLNIVWDYYCYSTSKSSCQVWDAVVTLDEGQGHQTKKRLYTPLVGLSSQQNLMGIAWKVSEIIEHLFSWLRSTSVQDLEWRWRSV